MNTKEIDKPEIKSVYPDAYGSGEAKNARGIRSSGEYFSLAPVFLLNGIYHYLVDGIIRPIGIGIAKFRKSNQSHILPPEK